MRSTLEPRVPRRSRKAAPSAPLLGALLCLALGGAWPVLVRAETIRVSTLNLQSAHTAPERDRRLAEAARVIDQAKPDVILLQQVSDWPMCARLVELLKPAEYSIAVCSSFASGTEGSSPGQVAILARHPAYFVWAEPWQSAGQPPRCAGYGFAAIQAGPRRLGFFTLDFDRSPGSELVGQWLAQLTSVRRWETNQVQTFVLAASFDTTAPNPWPGQSNNLRLLQDAGFLAPAPRHPAAVPGDTGPYTGSPDPRSDHILVDSSGFCLARLDSPVPGFDRFLISCDIELDPVQVAAGYAERVRSPDLAKALPEPLATDSRSRWLYLLPGGFGLLLLGLLFGFAMSRRAYASRQAPPALRASGSAPGGYTVVVAPLSLTGSTAPPSKAPPSAVRVELPGSTHAQSAMVRDEPAPALHPQSQASLVRDLRGWLKQKIVRRLLADRAGLLETQHQAEREVRALDHRLAEIERHIHHKTRQYERRIEELSRELLVAKDENRELIRARIAQVKAEMQAARAAMLAQAQQKDNPPGCG